MKEKKIKNLGTHPLIWVVIFFSLGLMPPLGCLLLLLEIILICYQAKYFNGQDFFEIKTDIEKYVTDCNELNLHILELRNAYVNIKKTDYGEARYTNISNYNYKKKGLSAQSAPNIYDCSRTVCSNAQKQPFKYICKYFNIKSDEETLEQFEDVFNKFSAAEEGKRYLKQKKDDIIAGIKVPKIIRKLFAKKLRKKLGFEEIPLNTVYFPTYTFRYISSGGNSGNQFTVTFNLSMLERFINYLNDTIKKRKSAAGQRALMTAKLRDTIKRRDKYTCKYCGNSTSKEPNLLLEIDHIVPISKGGLSTEENLQTLCWKCNRTKGAKLV